MQGKLGRWYLASIAFAAVLLLSALAMLGLDRAMRVQALAETRAAADGQAAILVAGLESELNKFTLVPRVLAGDPEVAALLGGDSTQRMVLNRRLAALAQQTRAAAIYLMDAEGRTLVASNWDQPDSFIGSNYGFREYFAGAIRDGTQTEFALGTVSRRPGLYLAERVGPAEAPLGVVAVKVEFDSLERKWRDAEDGVFVTDPQGIVLLASNPDWRFRAAPTGGEAAIARDPERDAMRYGVARPRPLELPGAGRAGQAVRMIEKIQPIAPAGWELHLLADPSARVSVAVANGRLAGLGVLVLIVLAAAGAFLWRRQRLARAAAEIAAQTATLRDQLQQANRLATLGQITAGLGHEIRQPLAAMRVYAETGERLLAADRPDEAAGNFAKIAGLAGRIGEITEEQLHFSRRSAEEPRDIRLADVIDGSLLLLRDQIRQKGLALVLPSAETGEATVRARHVQLEQVLVNLLQNAVQACEARDGGGGQIALAITADGYHVRLSVSDDGPGVPARLRETLFQPFVTSKSEGIGLGLAIAQDIMRQLGGDLVHEDTPTGARFTMIMPAA
ncbi:MAG: sensor histidine kinase [Sphingomonadales bacterium]|nr:MAG: sensor histidine kinase [Sphingomonadales bacterium]